MPRYKSRNGILKVQGQRHMDRIGVHVQFSSRLYQKYINEHARVYRDLLIPDRRPRNYRKEVATG